MMKQVPTEQVKPMDDEPHEFISAALRNSVVLRALMQQFSNNELLKLSLVNKLWNYEAKSLMRDRGIFPTFKSRESPCEELEAFAADVRHMDVVPFSGMNIQVFQSDLPDFLVCASARLPYTGVQLDPSYGDVLLDRLPLKRLSLHIKKNSTHQNNCQAILLAKKMLRHFAQVIEELSINAQDQQFIQDYKISDLCFRRLKTLKITGSSKERYGWGRDFVKGLVSRAPNLEQIQTVGCLHFMDDILEGSSAIVVPSGGVDPFDTELSESQFKRLRIAKMVVLTTSPNFSVERFNSRIPALLQTYRTTLNTLHMDVKCIGPLMSYRLCLPNVTEFKIYMTSARLEPTAAVVRLLKAFDFTRSLPALTKVDIINNHLSSAHDHIGDFIEQGNAVLRELMLDRASNIKHLCVTDYLSRQTARFLSQTFPHVEILSVEESCRSTFLCGWIWKYWTHLRTMDVKIDAGQVIGGRPCEHIDSKICGIFPEEVAELREKDEEFLKRVNIVPVMPSIGCFSDLRTFRLTYFTLVDQSVNEYLLCSKVSGLLVFARCPNLSVTIHNELPGKSLSMRVQEALDQMKPYASVTVRRFTPGEIYELEHGG